MLTLTPDESFIDASGKLIFFSIDRFVEDIGKGSHCFICGIDPSAAAFNDEHVLPDWILRTYDLHSKTIVLPNGRKLRYDRYRIPCCAQCNSVLGITFEDPISKIVAGGFDAVTQYLKESGPWLFFVWFVLIFIKTHLKDKTLRLHKSLRTGSESVADLYAWEEFHHLHCIARPFYTGCELSPEVMGSILVLPAQVESYFDNFDYADLYMARTMLLRLGEMAFIVVLNDSCAALSMFSRDLEKISGPLSPIQLREVMAHLAYLNLHLNDRPRFYSNIIPMENHCKISADHPTQAVIDHYNPCDLGGLIYHLCRHFIDQSSSANNEHFKQRVQQGKYSFLFDDNGKFIQRSLWPV